MTKSLKLLCLGMMGATALSGATAGSAMAAMMEIDITYYNDAAHSLVVGEYYKGCDGKVRKSGLITDFYDYVGSLCQDPPGPLD